MVDVNDMTIGEFKELASMVRSRSRSHSFEVGRKYFIRTLTYHYTGELAAVTDSDIFLNQAAWVADSGRFSEALKTGELSEVEPFPGAVVINRDAIVDFSLWDHDLPREVK